LHTAILLAQESSVRSVELCEYGPFLDIIALGGGLTVCHNNTVLAKRIMEEAMNEAPADKQKKECRNWLSYDAIRQTVSEYNQNWGAADDDLPDLSEFNMTQNCMTCNLRPELPEALKTVSQIAELFKDPVLKELEKVGMVRKCFKQKESSNG